MQQNQNSGNAAFNRLMGSLANIKYDTRAEKMRKHAEAIDYAARVRSSHPEMQVKRMEQP